MERIIKVREKIFGLIIVYGYILGISAYHAVNRNYQLNSEPKLSTKEYLIALYFVIWITYLVHLIHELLLYRRLDQANPTLRKIYAPKKRNIAIKFIISLITHLLFWGFIINNSLMFALISNSLGLLFLPTIIGVSIFTTDEYFIFSGYKYYYHSIKDYKLDSMYSIKLCIEDKWIYVSTGSSKRYDCVSGLLEEKIRQ